MNILFGGRRVELEPLVEKWQRRLSQADEAAVAQHSSPGFVAMLLAAARCGTALKLLNPRLTEAELAQLKGETPWAHELPDGPAKTRSAEVHTVLFTSGTSGTPKAVELSWVNHVANARGAIDVLGITRESRFVCPMPLYHVGGVGIVVRCALTGATMSLHEKFDAHAVADELSTDATHASLVATTLQRVLETGKRFNGATVLVGGGPVPKPLLERALQQNLRVLQTYGLTEAASMVTCEREPDGATAGPAMPHAEVRIVEGEIEVRGPSVMRGYRGHPRQEGWFRTGDLGELDAQGRLEVFSRRTDLILSGGENVYPAEIEAALLSHPRVREAAVVPAPDEKWGQVGVAYVASDASEAELRAHLERLLARYKLPAKYVFKKELPRLASGKLDRKALYGAG